MPGADWQLLSVTDNLKSGDIVKTSNDGRLEVLLNPGSYLRVAENSEFELADDSLESLEVKLIRGTAIVEATGAEETELAIGITTPHAKMTIVRRGLYRVNVVPGDATELFVRKGRVLLGSSQTKVKDGYKVIFKSTTFSVAKMNKADKEKDYFEGWSKQRADAVAVVNRRLQGKSVNAFLASYNDDWFDRIWFRRAAYWLFSPRAGSWTFLPYFYGWGSPYGSSYSCYDYRGDPRWGGWRQQPANQGWPVRPTPSSGSGPGVRSGPGSGPGGSSPSGNSPGSRGIGRDPDSPGRSIGKPDINPDAGHQRPKPPR